MVDQRVSDVVKDRVLREVVRARTLLQLVGERPETREQVLSALLSDGDPTAAVSQPLRKRCRTVRRYGDSNDDWALTLRQPTPDPEGRAVRAHQREQREEEGDEGEPPHTFIDWSEAVEKALGDPEGLIAVWRTEVLPHLGVRFEAETGDMVLPRPSLAIRERAEGRLRQLVEQYTEAQRIDQRAPNPKDATLLRAVATRGVQGVLTAASRLLKQKKEEVENHGDH